LQPSCAHSNSHTHGQLQLLQTSFPEALSSLFQTKENLNILIPLGACDKSLYFYDHTID
jgi:hypothetical protein